ncbi:RPA-related protein RADX-like [Lingula anatina]|uniref:RPA-related protein RADX-like n=1 Tax=Lingula anatina TaxID=7574 RepID=A0A1S3I7D5_LINAN|nr:RPA-related protein RADX-like [Lingula anatina]|eukprot:XP_013394113.1 RPA-related protein RADX-like [Lingula anatina]
MADVLKDCISNLKTLIRNSHSLGEQLESINVLVLAINRYAADPLSSMITNVCGTDISSLYDVTITDGALKMKCVFSPNLNEKIQRYEICVGSLVTLEECEVKVSETDLDLDSVVVINSVTVIPCDLLWHRVIPERLEWHSFATDKEKAEVPLLANRGSYLSTWNVSDPSGRLWQGNACPSFYPSGHCNVLTLKELSQQWKSLKRPLSAVIVRVLCKSRLQSYPRPGKTDKWPYQAYFEVADRSGACTVILWNSLCPELYKSIQEGSVLRLGNYRVRERFQMHTRPSLRNNDLEQFDIEISVNKHHPIGEVQMVPLASVDQNWHLPELKYRFANRRQLGSLPEDSNVDICGIITYISRYCRLRRKGTGCEGGFWTMRWLHVHDESSRQPVIVQLFSTSQVKEITFNSIQPWKIFGENENFPESHARLAPGQMLVCTQMRVIQGQLHTSYQQRFMYVTTTNESQVYTTGDHHRGQYMTCPQVKAVIQWCQRSQVRDMVSMATVGGYYDYPPLPSTLLEYKDLFNEEKPLRVTTSDNLETELRDIYYREQKRITFQGLIVQVKYVPPDHTRPGEGEEEEGEGTMEESEFTPVASRLRSKRKLSPAAATISPSKATKTLPQQASKNSLPKTTGRTMKKAQSPSKGKKTSPKKSGSREGKDKSAAVDRENELLSEAAVEQQVVVDPVWQRLLSAVTVLGSTRCQHSTPVLHSDMSAVELKKIIGLPPDHFSPADFEDFSYSDLKRPSYGGHLVVTILGLNERVAVNTIVLLPPHLPQHQNFTDLLAGKLDKSENSRNESETAENESGKNESESNSLPTVKQLMDSARAVQGRRVVCVVDLYSLGEGEEVEVILNRGYVAS